MKKTGKIRKIREKWENPGNSGKKVFSTFSFFPFFPNCTCEKSRTPLVHILRLKQTAGYAMEDGPGEGILWSTSYLTTVKYIKKNSWLWLLWESSISNLKLENKYLMRQPTSAWMHYRILKMEWWQTRIELMHGIRRMLTQGSENQQFFLYFG